MWHCPKCGEQIDDVFDACWKCGTAKDGTPAADFQAEPRYSDAIDPTSEPESSDEAAEGSVAASGDATPGRIVELCSAADVAEAYALRVLLDEAGIPSRVVGEFLGSAAGSLPLGETVAPRIWVRGEDAVRAREIIDERISRPCQNLNAFAECDEYDETDAASEEESPAPASAVGRRWLGRSLVLAGFACVLIGAVWAWLNWMTMRECSAATEGVLVGYEQHYSSYSPPPPEIPLPREPVTFSTWYEARYAFVVEGKKYYSWNRVREPTLDRVPIHYDPRHPATNFVGSLTPPRLILAWALGIGGSLSLVGYYLRSNRPRSEFGRKPST